MDLPNKTTFTLDWTTFPDVVTPGSYTAAQLKEFFNARDQELLDYTNAIKASTFTTGNLTYYVATTGSDSNDGSSGNPFLTIGKAISMIPQIVNHAVEIYVANGTYNETVALSGFAGKGSIVIIGANNLSVFANDVDISACDCFIDIQSFTLTTVSNHGVRIYRCADVRIYGCRILESAPTYDGINTITSSVHMLACSISNRNNAVQSTNRSMFNSVLSVGSGNVVGLRVSNGFIMKSAGQPGGATAEVVGSGGMII